MPTIQARAMALGEIAPLTPGEADAAEEFNLKPIAVDRAWEQWCHRAGMRS